MTEKEKTGDAGTTPKKSHKFLIGYILFVAFLLTLLLFFLRYAWESLTLYEASLPEYVVEDTIASISENGFSSLGTEALSFHPLESEEVYLSSVQELIDSYGITYELLKESYTDGSLLYGLYSGERSESKTLIATVTLMPGETTSRLYLLNITQWNLFSVTPYKETQNYSVTVTLPDNIPVAVNGQDDLADYITERTPYEVLTYCDDYVTVPSEVTYQITGLTQPVTLEIGSDTYSFSDYQDVSIELSFPLSEMSSDLERYVLDAVETYSNFFSKDLEGCRESVDPIRHLFPEDSIYLTLADQYRREDMGVFSIHTNTHFLNETVSEYTVYSEDCFSCRIQFDKSMTLSGGREMIDSTDNVYFFVYRNDSWVIADIR